MYTALQLEMNAYMTIIFLNLKDLVHRAYQGKTYRGAQMTQLDIDPYQWAQNNQDYVLATRVFQSTSQIIEVAQVFSETDPRSDRSGVLFTFFFNDKCITAVDLDELSQFQDEKEVLVLPFTLFKLDSISFDPTSRHYDINLINIPPSKQSFLASWWNLKN